MPTNSERGGCRFVVTKTDEGKPVIQLELFHDTVSRLKSFKVGFEVLSGTTPDQAKNLSGCDERKDRRSERPPFRSIGRGSFYCLTSRRLKKLGIASGR